MRRYLFTDSRKIEPAGEGVHANSSHVIQAVREGEGRTGAVLGEAQQTMPENYQGVAKTE